MSHFPDQQQPLKNDAHIGQVMIREKTSWQMKTSTKGAHNKDAPTIGQR